jgi:Alcohol dehydrogenase transcription factor Myb/SANT-like
MPSYYSQFVLNLIDEVKKREILYNTRYEKRPKIEKQEAWNEIAVAMER